MSILYVIGIVLIPLCFDLWGAGIKSPLSYDTHYNTCMHKFQVYIIHKICTRTLCILTLYIHLFLVYNKFARLRKADEIKRKPNQEGHVRAGTDKGD